VTNWQPVAGLFTGGSLFNILQHPGRAPFLPLPGEHDAIIRPEFEKPKWNLTQRVEVQRASCAIGAVRGVDLAQLDCLVNRDARPAGDGAISL
jgi:hypothetical protein